MERDADGFLLNSADWSEDVMHQMAKADGFDITLQNKTHINLHSFST